MNQHFSRRLTLKTQKDYQAVYQDGRKISCGCLAAYVKANELDYARLGVCITKRQMPKAVLRNKFKRRVKEFFRLNRAGLGHTDVVIVVYRHCVNLPATSFRKQLSKLWSKIDISATNVLSS